MSSKTKATGKRKGTEVDTAAAPASSSKKVKGGANAAVAAVPEPAAVVTVPADASGKKAKKANTIRLAFRDRNDTMTFKQLREIIPKQDFVRQNPEKPYWSVVQDGVGMQTGSKVQAYQVHVIETTIFNGLKYWAPNKAKNILNPSISAQVILPEEDFQTLENYYLDSALRYVHAHADEVLGFETGSQIKAMPYENAKFSLLMLVNRGWSNGLNPKTGEQWNRSLKIKVGRADNGYPLINVFARDGQTLIYHFPEKLSDASKLIAKDVSDYNAKINKVMTDFPTLAHLTQEMGGTMGHINCHLVVENNGFGITQGKICLLWKLKDIYLRPTNFGKRDVSEIPNARSFVPPVSDEVKAALAAAQAAARAAVPADGSVPAIVPLIPGAAADGDEEDADGEEVQVDMDDGDDDAEDDDDGDEEEEEEGDDDEEGDDTESKASE